MVAWLRSLLQSYKGDPNTEVFPKQSPRLMPRYSWFQLLGWPLARHYCHGNESESQGMTDTSAGYTVVSNIGFRRRGALRQRSSMTQEVLEHLQRIQT